MIDHAAYSELVAGRVFDDLATDEQRALDAHLPGCTSCQTLDHELGDVMTELAFAAQPRRVPAGLGASIMAAVAAPVSSGSAARSPSPATAIVAPMNATLSTASWLDRIRVRLSVPGLAFGAAALAVILIVGGFALILGDRLDRAQRTADAALAELASRDAALAVVADPAHRSATLTGRHSGDTGSATLVYTPGSAATYLLVAGLPANAPGSVYQFWYADGSGVHPGLTFDYPGSGAELVPVKIDLGGSQAAMLTLERTALAHTQPGTDVVFGELPQS
jgi:hypothetical protein